MTLPRDPVTLQRTELHMPELQRLPEDEQPNGPWVVGGGIFIKRITIARAGTFIPQHAHSYEHVSYIAVGRARVWRDGIKGDVIEEGALIVIPANVKHTFETLADRTTICCIHHEDRALAIAEEHQL